MTDRTTIRLSDDLDLLVAPADAGIRLSLLPVREAPAHISATVPTRALLASIDAADPDAMRAYLRETLDAIPEADSPEDVTETRVDRRYCDPLTEEEREQLREAGRTLGDAWRTFTDAVREGQFGATR